MHPPAQGHTAVDGLTSAASWTARSRRRTAVALADTIGARREGSRSADTRRRGGARGGRRASPRRGARRRWLGQQPGGPKCGQQARGGAHGGGVLAAMQRAQGGGVGEAVEHHTARARRSQDDRGRLGWVWWWGDHLNDAVAILHAPHRLFDPLHNALDAQPDRSGASSSALLVGGPATLLRAPQAPTTPTYGSRQLPMAARTDRPIGHDDTLPQFRTDETSLSISDLNARGVWFVGWSETVGGAALWRDTVMVRSGCVGGLWNWETWDVDKWGRGDVVGDGS